MDMAVKQVLDSVQKFGVPYWCASRCTKGRICFG